VSDKKLPVYVGVGFDRYQIGWASREIMPDGTVNISISINNPDWGEWSVAGFHPLRLRGLVPPVLERNTMPDVPDEDQADEVEAREKAAAEEMAKKLTEGSK